MDNTHEVVEDMISTIADLRELLDTIHNEFSHFNNHSIEGKATRLVAEANKDV